MATKGVAKLPADFGYSVGQKWATSLDHGRKVLLMFTATKLTNHHDVRKHTTKMTHIMLAEDNPADVFLIRRALDAEGFEYDILLARDGAEAIRYVAEAAEGRREIDLLLVDLNLPKRDGAEVLEQLRLHKNLKMLPAIAITS